MTEINKIQSFKTFSQIKEEEKNQQLQEETKNKREQLLAKISETLTEMDVTSFGELSEEQKQEFVAKLFNEESKVYQSSITEASEEEKRFDKLMKKMSNKTISDSEKTELFKLAFGDEFMKSNSKGKKVTYKESISENKLKFKVGDFIKKKNGGNFEYKIKSIDPKFDAVEVYLDTTGQSTKYTFKHINNDWKLAESNTNTVEEGNAFIYAAAKAKQEGKDSFEFNGKTYKVTLKKDTGLKESYQLLITEATRWQFGIIDKSGKIQSNYVHHDGYPSVVVPEIKGMNATKVKQILKDSEMGGMSSLGKYYNDSEKSTIITSEVKNIKKYLKEVGNEAGAEYVYLYDERDGQWYGADVYTDKELKPVEQLDEATIYEASGDFAGWIAIYNGKKIEIDKSEAKDLWGAKQLAIQKLKVPKSKQGILAIKAAVEESIVTEAEINSDEEFKEYAMTILKNAFGEEFEETKAQEVIDGLISKYNGDYGAMVGALQSSLD